MQARGSISQNEFLGGVQFKIFLKKWTFEQKKQKNHKNVTFHIPWGSIQKWGFIEAGTVYGFEYYLHMYIQKRLLWPQLHTHMTSTSVK